MSRIIYQVEYSVIDNKGTHETHYDKIYKTDNYNKFKKYVNEKGLEK